MGSHDFEELGEVFFFISPSRRNWYKILEKRPTLLLGL
jgi:hypothetical protein